MKDDRSLKFLEATLMEDEWGGSYLRVNLLINGAKECIDYFDMHTDLLKCDDHDIGYYDPELKAFIILSLLQNGFLELDIKGNIILDNEQQGYRCPHCEEWLADFNTYPDEGSEIITFTSKEHKMPGFEDLWLCMSCGNLIVPYSLEE